MTQRLEVITKHLQYLDTLSLDQKRKGINTDRLQQLRAELIDKRREIISSVSDKDAVVNLLIALG